MFDLFPHVLNCRMNQGWGKYSSLQMHVEQSQLLRREQFPLFPQRLMSSAWSKGHRNLVLVSFVFCFYIQYIFFHLYIFPLELLAINLRWILTIGFLCYFSFPFCINCKIIWFRVCQSMLSSKFWEERLNTNLSPICSAHNINLWCFKKSIWISHG